MLQEMSYLKDSSTKAKIVQDCRIKKIERLNFNKKDAQDEEQPKEETSSRSIKKTIEFDLKDKDPKIVKQEQFEAKETLEQNSLKLHSHNTRTL